MSHRPSTSARNPESDLPPEPGGKRTCDAHRIPRRAPTEATNTEDPGITGQRPWTEFVEFLRRQQKTYQEMLTHAQGGAADDHPEDMRCQIVAARLDGLFVGISEALQRAPTVWPASEPALRPPTYAEKAREGVDRTSRATNHPIERPDDLPRSANSNFSAEKRSVLQRLRLLRPFQPDISRQCFLTPQADPQRQESIPNPSFRRQPTRFLMQRLELPAALDGHIEFLKRLPREGWKLQLSEAAKQAIMTASYPPLVLESTALGP